jgi:hypothetical protein
MAHKMVTASAKKGAAKKHKGSARHMNIERAENGFKTSTSFDQPEGEGAYEPPMDMVHETPESMHEHVAAMFPPGKAPAGKDEPDGDEADE